ncbi:uncharacterized protein TOT_040000433 [Theileria orientalis strain Shintoku]|uniref:Uncharacterized protein n=1 Tax=Theileria orientalis strain Shintoku TaxID=869250 RepID=J4CE06_THEOR|nr:uncharacterized protein TOT_040000433 [Theileria orientalis strain Shintoku]BAM42057.1 uncharacterized protein TOT_040000433 [Theileria orientalis strain Shintoku]|eukprot:XP_009692358.1 uncharacterized protein TOT_040000433 [Theileria orientalis strain Shintoku]
MAHFSISKSFDLEGLELRKAEANSAFTQSDYKTASKLYYNIIKDAVGIDTLDVDVEFLKNRVKKWSSQLTHPDFRRLLSTVTSNMAMCCNRMEKREDAKTLFETALVFDENNYKANYNLAHSHLISKDYNMSLYYIERCQKIVKSDLPSWKNKKQPHLDLMEQVRQTLKKNDVTRGGVNDPKQLAEEVCNENNVTLNLQKLRLIPTKKMIQSEALPELVELCQNKVRDKIVDDVLVSVWSCLYHMLYKCEEEYKEELHAQFMNSFKSRECSLYDYAKSLLNINKESEQAEVVSVLNNVAKCCPLVKGVDGLKALLLLMEPEMLDVDLVLSSILVYFSKTAAVAPVKQKDASFNLALSKVLQKLISMCDEECLGLREQLEACLMSIFRMEFEGYEVTQDSFSNMVNSALEPYVNTELDGVSGKPLLSFENNWYVAAKCMFLANKTIFKAHVVVTGAVQHLCRVHFTDYSERTRRLSFETLLNCVDFVEFRQEMLDFVHDNQCFLELLNSPEVVRFSNELVNSAKVNATMTGPEGEEVSKHSGKHEFLRWMVESRVLMFAKVSLHSAEVKDEVLNHFDLCTLLPKMVLNTINSGLEEDMVLQALSFATLHEEFKRADLSFIPELVTKYKKTDCSTLLVVQSITNLLRGSKDRNSFIEDLELAKYDSEQLKQLKTLQERLPAQAKLTTNGNYFEGNDESANMARSVVFSVGDNAVPTYLAKVHKSAASEHTKMLLVEALHYLALNVNHRRQLNALGVLRILINVANSSKYRQSDNRLAATYRSMSCYKLVVQSVAHLCIATSPTNLTFNDAQDAVKPLLNLLEDENELFQYESALALTNLLSINDDVRRRVFALGGWDRFSSLLFSDNEMLKTAALEGWCNLCAGDDVVHGHFYGKIRAQVEATPEGNVFEVSVHDINIMLMFIAHNLRQNTVSAASGAFALLVRDSRIAQYMPFVSRFENVLKTLDGTDDASIIHRLLTALSCVVNSKLRDANEVNEAHFNSVVENIRAAVRHTAGPL